MLGGGAIAVFVALREVLLLLTLAQREFNGRSLGERAARVLETSGIDRASASERIQALLGQLSSHVAQAVGIVLQTTTGALLALVMALWTMYYVLLEGQRVATRLERICPLDPRDTRALMREFRDVGRDAFIATIANALLQGLLSWIGFALAGVPRALTWSVLLALLSVVPLLGTTLVWVPVGVYLIVAGHVVAGIFVLAWGALVVIAIPDYVIRPRLVGARVHRHPLLTLVSLVGGVSVLGLPGLVVGPVIVSLFVAIMRIYERDAGNGIH